MKTNTYLSYIKIDQVDAVVLEHDKFKFCVNKTSGRHQINVIYKHVYVYTL